MVYNSLGMHEDGKMGFVRPDLILEMYENIIIDVVWVIDCFLVKWNPRVSCLHTLVLGIYLIAMSRKGFLFGNLKGDASNTSPLEKSAVEEKHIRRWV